MSDQGFDVEREARALTSRLAGCVGVVLGGWVWDSESDARSYARDSLTRAYAAGREAARREATTALNADGPELRMDGYYIGFRETGIRAVDRILSAVACAGKSFHHTDSWGEEATPRPGLRGDSPMDWIQNAANDLAAILAALTEGESDAK